MLNKFCFVSLVAFALSGCSDFWNTYQVIDGVPDAGPDMRLPPCQRGEAYDLIDGVYTTCCDPNDNAKSALNVQKTIEQTQTLGVASPINIKIGCETPREFQLLALASSAPLGESSRLPVISQEMIINGNGCTLSARGEDRHFLVKPNVALTLRNMKLSGGIALTVPDPNRWNIPLEGNPKLPTDAACGGSILSFGRLTLENVYLTDNKADHEFLAAGGAICIIGAKLTLKNSIVYMNTAISKATIGRADGAAVYINNGDADFTFSTVQANFNQTKYVSGGAAIHFAAANGRTLTNSNSLLVNYYVSGNISNATANYAILLGCGMSTNLTPGSAFDKMLKAGNCPSGYTGVVSTVVNKYAADWAAPTAYPLTISPNAVFDPALQASTDPTGCATAGPDYFGNPRKATKCMPGAVELRQ